MQLGHFNKVFTNTTNSYKYYWWLSIIEICFEKDTNNISFYEITLKVISKIWYPVNYFKLSFGKQDKCSGHIREIKKAYNLADNIKESDLYLVLLNNKDSELLKKISKELTRYVPFRFIRPWYSECIRGIKDGEVNSRILNLQNESSPYVIDINSMSIIINADWFYWIKTNFNLIESYTYFELLKYLEKENPNVTNLTIKLTKPLTRKLAQPTKFWKKFIYKNPFEIDVFQKVPLISIDQLSIDHFLPWSFVAHDLIWNLHPVNKNINSSKNNFLPSLNYLNSFSSIQFNFCKFLLEEDSKLIENYYTLFSCSKYELENISKELFTKKMNEKFLPKFEIATNMGFDNNWTLG
jgi:hypothetical protein